MSVNDLEQDVLSGIDIFDYIQVKAVAKEARPGFSVVIKNRATVAFAEIKIKEAEEIQALKQKLAPESTAKPLDPALIVQGDPATSEDENQQRMWISNGRLHFCTVSYGKNGEERRVVFYDRLIADYKLKFDFFMTEESEKLVYIHNGLHHEGRNIATLDNYLNAMIGNRVSGITKDESNRLRLMVSSQKRFPASCLHENQRYRLNFANGVLDIKNMTFAERNKSDLFFYVIPYDYTEGSDETPLWNRLMNLISVNRQDLIDMIEFYIGYILSYEDASKHQYIMIFHGAGENGKTYLINTIQAMLTSALYTEQSLGFMGKDKFALAAIEGKIAILSDEEGVDVFNNVELLKKIVGGARAIQIEKKFSQSYSTPLMAKPIISTNKLPFISETSHGFLRRLLFVPFDLNFNSMTQEAQREAKIPDVSRERIMFQPEFPAVIRRCLHKFRTMNDIKSVMPAAMKAVKDKAIRRSDAVGAWLNETVIWTGERTRRLPLEYLHRLYIEEIESGKMHGKKKLGNFKNDVEDWANGFIKDNTVEKGVLIEKNRLYNCVLLQDAGIIQTYGLTDKVHYSAVKRGDVLVGFKHVKDVPAGQEVITITKRDDTDTSKEESYEYMVDSGKH